MNVFDFISQDEMDDLPHDDSEAAFLRLVTIADGNYKRIVHNAYAGPETDWDQIKTAKRTFVNIVVAAAKEYGIEHLEDTRIPSASDFEEYFYENFQSDLDHYMAQLMIDMSRRQQRDSVALPERSKDRIRQHIHALKEIIDKASVSDTKKEKLFRKLQEFEETLEKRRLNILVVARITLEVFGLLNGAIQVGDAGYKLITNIMQEVGEAKQAENETRDLPPMIEPRRISAPRSEEGQEETPKKAPAFTGPGMDDDIPF